MIRRREFIAGLGYVRRLASHRVAVLWITAFRIANMTALCRSDEEAG